MTSFHDHDADRDDPRRSIGLGDLPTLRDARGEPATPETGPPDASLPVDGSENAAATSENTARRPASMIEPGARSGGLPIVGLETLAAAGPVERPQTITFARPAGAGDGPASEPIVREPVVAPISPVPAPAPAADRPTDPPVESKPAGPAGPSAPNAPSAPGEPMSVGPSTEISFKPVRTEPDTIPADTGPVTVRPDRPEPTEAPAPVRVAPSATRATESARPDVHPSDLRSMLDEAQAVMGQLQTGVDAARTTATRPARVADDLQERLRVGARMLKAFQAQIDRAEEAVREAADRTETLASIDAARTEAIRALEATQKAETVQVRKDLAAAIDAAREAIDERAKRRARPAVEVEQIVAEVESHVREILQRADTHIEARIPEIPSQDAVDLRVEQAVQSAIERFDRHAGQTRGDLDAHVDQARAVQSQVLELADRVDDAETQAQRLSAVAEETARTIRAETDEARTIARLAQEAKAAVNTDLRRAMATLEDVGGRGERVRLDVEEQIARFERLREHVAASFGGIDAAVRKVERVESTVDRLERLVEMLAPWEALLLDAPRTADGIPRPAVEMVERLQATVGRDMEAISSSMQEMAERMAGLGGQRTVVPAAKPTEAPKSAPARTATKPASTAEARPGGFDQPIPNRPDRSEVLSALDAERRHGDAAKIVPAKPVEAPASPRLTLRKTGST